MLAAFMGGLAAGALAGGRVAPRLTPRDALRAYASMEVAIGAFALLVPTLLRLAHPLLSVAYADGHGGVLFQAVRFACAAAVVGIPALLMGATYPVIVRASGVEGDSAGLLYASNTIGAAIGATAAGFVLIRVLGTMGAVFVGVAGNVLAAVIAWRLTPASDSARGRAEQRIFTGMARVPAIPLVAAATAGFAALSIEVAWTRTLAMVMGPTTYAFSAMVSCFIGGLALGSTMAAGVARRSARPHVWMGLLFALTSMTTAIAIAQVGGAVLDTARRAADPNASLALLLVHQLKWAALLIVPSAACFGALFPVVLAAARAESADAAATVYASNTAGAIAGSLGAGLLLIPQFGLRTTFAVAIVVTAGAALLAVTSRVRRSLAGAVAVIVVTAVALGALRFGEWNPKLLSSGAYKYSAYLREGDDILPDLLAAGTLKYYREGASGTVSIRDVAGARSLAIDGKVDASNGRDMLTQRLLAHLPLLTHGRAERVAIVGLGSGVTLGSALTYPLDSAEAIEISPEVIAASNWFARENRDALRDRRVRLIQEDARTHFRLGGRERYDVIISEPSNPWMAGVAALFTREFFETLARRLSPGGVVCQWTHTYDISPADLRSIVGTFSHAFPDVSMWLVGDGDLLLVGGMTAGSAAASRVFASSPPPSAAADLARSGIRNTSDLSLFHLGDAALARRWATGAALQTDDRMALEFSAPGATVGASGHDNARDLLEAARRMGGQQVWNPAAAGALLIAAQAPRRAWPHLAAAVASEPDDIETVANYVKAAAANQKLPEAERTLDALSQQHPAAVAVRLELAKVLAARGDVAGARAHGAAAAAVRDDDPRPLEALAGIAADAGDVDTLDAIVARLRSLQPGGASVLYYEGVLSLFRGESDRARRLAEEALALDPRRAPAWNLLGAALGESRATPEEIRRAFQRAIASDPRDVAGYVNLARVDLHSGRIAEAIDEFSEALTLDPSDASARAGLQQAKRQQSTHPIF